MAGASAKKQVQTNLKLLKFIQHLVGITYLIASISIFYFHRPANSKPFILGSIPVIISLYVIEKTGRPKFDSSGKLVSAGQDLTQPGLVEYLFDIIYFTVFLIVLSVVFGTNKFWWFYTVIPGFGAYKLYGVFNIGKQLLGFGGNKKSNESTEDSTTSAQNQKSKRQQKLEARGDKQKIRYR